MLEVDDAQKRIVSAVQPLASENVPLDQTVRRILAKHVAAPISLPSFDNSAMDGYAVHAVDVQTAAAATPVSLKCIGAVPAGQAIETAVNRGTCVRLFTGSALPDGANAVVMQEETRIANGMIEVFSSVKPWENVRLAGEDIKAGIVVGEQGEPVTAARLALFGALGIAELPVIRRPIVGVIGTGNELVTTGQPGPGQIYESNRLCLASLITQIGADVRVFALVRDSLGETRAALQAAFEVCDVVVTTGGVSVGEHDVVKPAFQAIGGTCEFWKIAVKPGKPFMFGRWREKLLFGLPGNPVSAFVTCLVLVRPALLKLQGAKNLWLPAHPGILAEEFANQGDRIHFIRANVDPKGMVCSAGLQASHALGSLANANALLAMPPETIWPAGRTVEVLRWEF